MQTPTAGGPWWAALAVWSTVNAVNILQTVGFLSRLRSGSLEVNHLIGYGIILLAVPVLVSLVAFVRSGAGWVHWAGPAAYLAFVSLLIAVEYVRRIEFRSPVRYGILVPYLVLFFGAIFLLGVPMFRLSRPLWLVTVATTACLLASMSVALRAGVG